MAILVEVAVLMSLGAMIMGAAGGGGGGSGAASVLRAALSNPLVGAIVAGGMLAATGVGLPDPVDPPVTVRTISISFIFS